ncbi:MAG TPA: LysM peptidoglycan-binding domain-containing protein, partial [Candidatus Micrarchaeaceae archaeon]|nr:LysM peptidoglycan-binding domain-containing protein [Candidatus Micrarchaeaceae archaeon]
LLKVTVLALLVGAIMTQVVLGTSGTTGPSVVVQPGQTLWGIAIRHYPQSDPRAAIAAIESANHLISLTITPGERLVLPPV